VVCWRPYPVSGDECNPAASSTGTHVTKGAEKREEHGSKGSTVCRDPSESGRVWVVFDWDLEGFQNFASDPEVPAIMQEAGHRGKPQEAELGGQYDA
jgi:hypothetical protein